MGCLPPQVLGNSIFLRAVDMCCPKYRWCQNPDLAVNYPLCKAWLAECNTTGQAPRVLTAPQCGRMPCTHAKPRGSRRFLWPLVRALKPDHGVRLSYRVQEAGEGKGGHMTVACRAPADVG